MKKISKVLLLTTLLTTQFSQLIGTIALYASEIEASEVSSSITEVASADETASEVESDNTLTSEVVSEEVVTIDSDIEATLSITDSTNSKARSATTETETVLGEDENLTTYVNQERIDSQSGEATITISPTSSSPTKARQITNQEVYYTLDEQGNITSGTTRQPRSYSGNLLTVYNGTIVEADSAIARTSGGYTKSFYMYETLEDLKSEENGVPFSGGGFDGTYLETIEEDGVYYYRVKISGFEGYVAAENIQIVPEELIQSRSYYIAEDGNWVYYSAIDPLNSTDYDVMVIDQAPEAATPNVKYYSDDDVNYTTDPIISATTTASVSYNTYFMNLSFRSESSYTAANYKSYLAAKSKTGSTYYNSTSAFTDAQNLESINSLLIFSMANHESAYGLSTYAKACYNFFGRGAVDSDPDKACQQYGYDTARDGILAQTLFLQNGYFDVYDWRYSGTHVGNKASGMNVKYASDSDWGKKISNHAYMTDQYLGGKDEGKYTIIQVKGSSNVYTTSGLSKTVKSQGDSASGNYNISANTGTSDTVNVVATAKNGNAYRIYVPTAVKQSSSSDCSYTNSRLGSYPNYGSRTKYSISTGVANYSCDYESVSKQQYWISSSNTTVLNKGTEDTITSTEILEYHTNGKVKYRYYVDSSTSVIKYSLLYDTNGNLINKYTYFSGTKYGDNHRKKIQHLYYVKNNLVYKSETRNTSSKTITVYEYYNNTTLDNVSSKIKMKYNINPSTGYITNAYRLNTYQRQVRVLEYFSGTKYGSHTNRIRYRFDLKSGTNYITTAYRYNSVQNINKLYTYQSNTVYGNHSRRYKDIFYLKGSNMELTQAIGYNTSNQKVVRYTYKAGTIYGNGHGSRISARYYY